MISLSQRPPAMLEQPVSSSSFREEVLSGLSSSPKSLPCKFFYDQRGSELFERICELEEYYPTRTEMSIMRRFSGEMAECLGEDCLLVEFGSGSSLKTRVLLDEMVRPAGYVPLDISREHLLASSARLSQAYPDLDVAAVCADYTRPFTLPEGLRPSRRTCVYFPGSTIGNFDPEEALPFLRQTARVCGSEGLLLIGVDLKKDPEVLRQAYNDAEGVTALFNLNILRRINRELDADFDLAQWEHLAFYNAAPGRIEMHLRSRTGQSVHIAGQTIRFSEGETIHTENSHKYTPREFARLASEAGFERLKIWTDPESLFSVQCFRLRPRP